MYCTTFTTFWLPLLTVREENVPCGSVGVGAAGNYCTPESAKTVRESGQDGRQGTPEPPRAAIVLAARAPPCRWCRRLVRSCSEKRTIFWPVVHQAQQGDLNESTGHAAQRINLTPYQLRCRRLIIRESMSTSSCPYLFHVRHSTFFLKK
jgi:hypothetical protein